MQGVNISKLQTLNDYLLTYIYMHGVQDKFLCYICDETPEVEPCYKCGFPVCYACKGNHRSTFRIICVNCFRYMRENAGKPTSTTGKTHIGWHPGMGGLPTFK